jgi:RNA polymerase sigma-70 factor (ECF subfamily)
MTAPAMDRETEFFNHRPLLFALAYRMLGTRADAEDIVQEAYLRWQAAGTEDVRSPKSFLMTVVARLALDSLKTAHRKRETYVGPWLPEPVVEPTGTKHMEMAESLSLAFLRLLESLSPTERVAFLLREVFDAGYGEVATALETTEANSRQIVARARKHVQERRPRFTVDRERQSAVVREFLAACATGDASQLTALLAQDAVLYTDGGGKVSSALNPIFGADRIARFLVGVGRKIPPVSVQFADVNGAVGAVLLDEAGRPYSVLALDVTTGGLIANLYVVSNPEKLPPSAPQQSGARSS